MFTTDGPIVSENWTPALRRCSSPLLQYSMYTVSVSRRLICRQLYSYRPCSCVYQRCREGAAGICKGSVLLCSAKTGPVIPVFSSRVCVWTSV